MEDKYSFVSSIYEGVRKKTQTSDKSTPALFLLFKSLKSKNRNSQDSIQANSLLVV